MKGTLKRRAGLAALLTLCLCLQLLLTSGAYDPTTTIDGTDADIAPQAVGTPINEVEPNDTYNKATPTDNDRINFGAIYTNTDVDWWRISFTQSGKANFWLGNIPAGCNYDLEVYEPNGITRIAVSSNQGNTAELIRMNVIAGKMYHIRIFAKSGSSTSKYCLRIKNYPTIPANAIGVYVTDTNGQPIENAVVYIYPQRSRVGVNMFPDGPFYTDAYGFVQHTGLVAGARYAINVMANDYAAKSYKEYVKPSTEYVTFSLERRNTTMLNDPLTGFVAKDNWGHSETETASCEAACPRICPQKYMDVEIPQNFGWRYDVDSRIEFHQALDITAAIGTPVYNVFKNSTDVTISKWIDGAGNTVQLEVDGLYATYMHLSASIVSKGTMISGGVQIGTAGKTGTGAPHLHISFSTNDRIAVSRSNDASDSNVINWDASQIEAFLDPLNYIS